MGSTNSTQVIFKKKERKRGKDSGRGIKRWGHNWAETGAEVGVNMSKIHYVKFLKHSFKTI